MTFGDDVVARAEHLEVDAGGDDGDPRRVGSVEVDEFSGLAGGVGDERRGRVDDLLLTDLAPRRLGSVTRGELTVLDPRHRVHRVDERHPPPVGREPPDLAREPVVGMHEVVVPLRLRRADPHHAGRERAQLARQIVLAEPLVRPGGDVVDGHAGRQFDLLTHGRARAPREDVDGDAALREPLRRLDDVDVEAARVTRPRLRQR